MYEPSPVLRKELSRVAEAALRASGMDTVGLYRFDNDGRFENGIILAMPDEFVRSYEVVGIPIDPILNTMRETGGPCSTLTQLGDRWGSCELYRRVSGRYGLKGFATLPLYRQDDLAGILYLGALSQANADRLNIEGICQMTPHATRVSTSLLSLPLSDLKLTPRQNDIASLAAEGLSNRQIALELGTGEAAVRKHLKSLNAIFGTHNRTAMAAQWRKRSGLG